MQFFNSPASQNTIEEDKRIDDVKHTALAFGPNRVGNEGIETLVAKVAADSKIKTLILTDNDLNDKAIIELTKLKQLEVLALESNEISDDGAKALATMTNLKELALGGNNISDIGAAALAEAEGLFVLRLHNNKKITDKGAELFLRNKKLVELTLYNEQISTEFLKKIEQHIQSNRKAAEANYEEAQVESPVPSASSGMRNSY
jgi:Ran GTPase-activating protein (RanGAP) involved in mRNA processing and transport